MVIIPWEVDVCRDRVPVINWTIIAVTVVVFFLQLHQWEAAPPDTNTIPGITDDLILKGWALPGLVGHFLLHGGWSHLIGNMVFLWIFGNAVCAKLGNARYLLIYPLLGVASGVAHLMFSNSMALGASGAINGIVGMFLMFYPQNEITCVYWFIFYVGSFSVSSYKMILWWLFWDLFGLFCCSSISQTAYIAHLGGFGAGLVIAFVLCKWGWVTTARGEGSILDIWRERREEREALVEAKTVGNLTPLLDHHGLHTHTDEMEPSNIPPPNMIDVTPPERATIACPCGNSFELKQDQAGTKKRCHLCGARLEIPAGPLRDGMVANRLSITLPSPSQPAMIRFTCPCGKRIKVPTRHAGRTGRCPACGNQIRIPNQD